jgi:hypothetical protein
MHQHPDRRGGTVTEYTMPAEHLTNPPPVRDRNAITGAMEQMALRRLGERVPYMTLALEAFEESSKHAIEQHVEWAAHFEKSVHVEFPWTLLETALGLGLSFGFAYYVEKEAAKKIFDKVVEVTLHELTSKMEKEASGVEDLRHKLESGRHALLENLGINYARAVDEVKADINVFIVDELEHFTNTDLTDDPEWIQAMVEWFGFPEPTYDMVGEPIRSSLTEQFAAMLRDAEDEFVRNAG